MNDKNDKSESTAPPTIQEKNVLPTTLIILLLLTVVVIAAMAGLAALANSTPNPIEYDLPESTPEQIGLVNNLTDAGWTLFSRPDCRACYEQATYLGTAYYDLNRTDCQSDPTACNEQNIVLVPTWQSPNGTLYVGYYNLSDLQDMLNGSQPPYEFVPVEEPTAEQTPQLF